MAAVQLNAVLDGKSAPFGGAVFFVPSVARNLVRMARPYTSEPGTRLAVVLSRLAEREGLKISHTEELSAVVRRLALKTGLKIKHTERDDDALAAVLEHFLFP